MQGTSSSMSMRLRTSRSRMSASRDPGASQRHRGETAVEFGVQSNLDRSWDTAVGQRERDIAEEHDAVETVLSGRGPSRWSHLLRPAVVASLRGCGQFGADDVRSSHQRRCRTGPRWGASRDPQVCHGSSCAVATHLRLRPLGIQQTAHELVRSLRLGSRLERAAAIVGSSHRVPEPRTSQSIASSVVHVAS